MDEKTKHNEKRNQRKISTGKHLVKMHPAVTLIFVYFKQISRFNISPKQINFNKGKMLFFWKNVVFIY